MVCSHLDTWHPQRSIHVAKKSFSLHNKRDLSENVARMRYFNYMKEEEEKNL